MDFGSLGNAGYVDLHDGITVGNDADARMIVTNGVQGTNFAGQLTLQSGALAVISSSLGFYGHAAVAKPTIAGSRGGNAALQSLITALANFGLVVDSSSL